MVEQGVHLHKQGVYFVCERATTATGGVSIVFGHREALLHEEYDLSLLDEGDVVGVLGLCF